MNKPFLDQRVENTFNSYPSNVKHKLLFLREIIFRIAEQHAEIGNIKETLKWQNPSYLTFSPKSGTTIRLSARLSQCDKYAISVHCQTNLLAEFKALYPQLEYDGNRSIIFELNKKLPLTAVEHFIYAALTYFIK